ncbi:MAG: hypothetical protein ACI9S8_002869 [Chlamydiales bacterium]|jgi:hypothetical protein
MNEMPPLNILTKDMLPKYLKDHPEIQHIVMLDDGAYSGEQACEYIDDIGDFIRDRSFHVSIPYMTTYAYENILKTIKEQSAKAHFPIGQRMLSYNELLKFGYFGYQLDKNLRPNVAEFLKLPPITEDKINEKIDEINKKLDLLQINIFQNHHNDQYVKTEIQSFIDDVAELFPEEERNESVHELLRKCSSCIRELSQRRIVDKNLEKHSINEYINFLRDNKEYPHLGISSRTGTWMAHKSADYVSTDVSSMVRATREQTAIEPYKPSANSKRFKDQIHKLEVQTPKNKRLRSFISSNPKLQWLENSIQLVYSNRGVFLLGSNYIRDDDSNDKQVKIIVDNEEISLGGYDGEYQWRLKVGQSFQIQQGDSEVSLLLTEDGLQKQ